MHWMSRKNVWMWSSLHKKRQTNKNLVHYVYLLFYISFLPYCFIYAFYLFNSKRKESAGIYIYCILHEICRYVCTLPFDSHVLSFMRAANMWGKRVRACREKKLNWMRNFICINKVCNIHMRLLSRFKGTKCICMTSNLCFVFQLCP